jgi:type I restriction enzyme S subunit
MSQVYGLVPSKKMNRKSLQSENYAGGKLVARHDLVLNRLKAHLGVFARATEAGVVSPDYTVLRPIGDISVHYCESLFKTPMYVGEFRRRTKGIVEGFWRLYTDDFYNVTVLLPPRVEQDQIVAYLRAQDAHIARFIKAKRELIKLLTEQKLRIIDQAVTRGLDPNVRLKDSGVEWLGEVPEHWEVAFISRP